MKKTKTKEEKIYLSKVAKLPCSISDKNCGGRVEIHHRTNAGMGLRASHYDTMPLCFNHHSAQTPLAFGDAVHKGTKTFEKKYGTQDDLIKQTQEMLA